jgi:transglutaminase-like putative cysteine protease
MRVLVALAVSACATGGLPRQTAFPTLRADDHARPMPIDPYLDDEPPPPVHPLHEVVGDDHVPTDVDWGDPGAVVAMTVRIDAGTYTLPSNPTDRVEPDKGSIQRVTIEVKPGARVTAAERADALAATATIDALDPAIRKAARDATAGVRGDRRRVAALVDWVHANITYVLADETIASHVLARGSGDCSEMSILFVALARAAGIPARRVDGLAATEVGGAPAFGFHAWAEVALDGHWVQVDPTWDEPVADATHVLLRETEPQWLLMVDTLRVAVVDLRHDKRLAGHADVRQLARELPAYMQLRR